VIFAIEVPALASKGTFPYVPAPFYRLAYWKDGRDVCVFLPIGIAAVARWWVYRRNRMLDRGRGR
jgi:hypothetical protein